jgi:hypothetical protein
MNKEQIQILKDVEEYLSNSTEGMCINAVYTTPAGRLRQQADEIEAKDRAINKFRDLIVFLETGGYPKEVGYITGNISDNLTSGAGGLYLDGTSHY